MAWMEDQPAEHEAKLSSRLGKSIQHMLRDREPLMLFPLPWTAI